MSIDEAVIGSAAMALMDQVKQHHTHESVEIDAIGMVVAIRDGEAVTTHTVFRDGTGTHGLPPYAAIGLFETAKRSVKS